jgi:predicted transcriptional regulator
MVLSFSLRSKKNRFSLEIARDMLLIASERVRKTRIMYQANLSYRIMEKYLKKLLDSGLLERDDGSLYLITVKGKEFLQMYADFVERNMRIRQDIEGIDKDRSLLVSMCFNDEGSLKRMVNRRDKLSCDVEAE